MIASLLELGVLNQAKSFVPFFGSAQKKLGERTSITFTERASSKHTERIVEQGW